MISHLPGTFTNLSHCHSLSVHYFLLQGGDRPANKLSIVAGCERWMLEDWAVPNPLAARFAREACSRAREAKLNEPLCSTSVLAISKPKTCGEGNENRYTLAKGNPSMNMWCGCINRCFACGHDCVPFSQIDLVQRTRSNVLMRIVGLKCIVLNLLNN